MGGSGRARHDIRATLSGKGAPPAAGWLDPVAKSANLAPMRRAPRQIRAAILSAVIAGCGTMPAAAQDAPAWPEFTFKRVKPPAPGQKRIIVQVDPEEQAAFLAAGRAAAEARAARAAGEADTGTPPGESDAEGARPAQPAGPDPWGWFWAQVPPSGGGAAILPRALALLKTPPASGPLRMPRLETLRAIADRHGTEILKATVGTRVSPAFALAVISVESGGRADAVSHAGASGLMQLMPATAERFGVPDRAIAGDNIRGGVTYLDWLLDEFDGDPVLALAGYNAGENAVKSHGGVPPFAETRGYVPKVLAAWDVARGLCLTPPELVSDGCVFIGRRTASDG